MMSSFQVVGSSPNSSVGVMETSNFAHVIFQNVGKSFLPQAALECCYTLTPYLIPNPKDWVGIFKVGWSTARDYYTFLWSPMPEDYEPGSTVHRTVVFQGYYVPKSDGEFYQFCYVTHTGDIRGASTPFLFRPATPTEELLTVSEDDSNSDILVVTTKSGLLEEAQQERRELLKAMHLLQEEKKLLLEEQRRLARERELERETCSLLRTHNQELLRSSQGLSEEREDVRRRLQAATERVRQLEEDMLGVTQRGLQKETELDCIRDRLKKLLVERDSLEGQLKNEKDERDLYKAHLRSTELENTKLSAELQMLKAVELNREVTIAQFQEELERLRSCVAQRDSLEKELSTHTAGQCARQAEVGRLREQLRRAEEQLQASRQQASMLASELRDSTSARDRTMTELYRARLEADALRGSLADAQAECQRMETQLDRMRSAAQQEVGVGTSSEGVVSEAEAELQREVEELKLRLHMAAEHYKEKYRECQRLRRQVAKLSEAQGESKRNPGGLTLQETLTPSPESPTRGSLAVAVLQGMTEKTCAPEHNTGEALTHTYSHTYSHTYTHTEEEEDRQGTGLGEGESKGRGGEEVGRDVHGGEERGKEGNLEKEERHERSVGEDSLRMGSWVEVENETKSAEENDEGRGVVEEEDEDGRSVEEEEGEDEDEDGSSVEEGEDEDGRSMEEVEMEGRSVEEVEMEGRSVEEVETEGRSVEEVEMEGRSVEEVETEGRSVEEVEKEQTRSVEEELASMEEKWREQCAINETLKQRLANEEERFRIHMAERAGEVTELKHKLAQALRDKEKLQEELQQCLDRQREREAEGSEVKQPVVLRYPLPYPQDPSPPPLVPHRPAELQYGNPYSADSTRDGADGALSPEQMPRPPPEAPTCGPPASAPGATWERGVVCIQPSRSMSPPDGLEHPPEEPRNVGDGAQPACNHQAGRRNEGRSSFCFDPSGAVHKRCPLCEVIFPPHFEQRSFEQHVESHWKVCPVCSQQFPLDCQQQLFERHVLTHFDGHVLNFDNIE